MPLNRGWKVAGTALQDAGFSGTPDHLRDCVDAPLLTLEVDSRENLSDQAGGDQLNSRQHKNDRCQQKRSVFQEDGMSAQFFVKQVCQSRKARRKTAEASLPKRCRGRVK